MVKEYLNNFEGSIDNSILDWISYVSIGTKLDEYLHIEYTDLKNIKKLENLINEKNFIHYKKSLTHMLEAKELIKKNKNFRKKDRK